MKRIASFSVDHDKILPGMYISRIDGDITTFDLRTRRPNCGNYMDNRTMHSVEHMLATLLRNGEIGESVIYFGPMGCQTGFYLLTRDLAPEPVREALLSALRQTVEYTGEMPGAARRECGNYLNLSLDDAKKECAAYLAVLENQKGDFSYDE
ncbi:MAG: S-ribosylhomocysteine lyase [Ruminococcaceae bacterium]|nr:S-ribosylhomocysteine lyase [Oscillospiraceae bacterium]